MMWEQDREEKKVEYLELIYDLIFVYLIGRNNSLLHHVEGGFVSGDLFLTYVVCTLAIIQIWNFSTFYINRYGRNGLRDHVFIFINMYLLYYMADGTRIDWQGHFTRYNVAWALILINTGAQYLIERRNHKVAPWEITQITGAAAVVLIEALSVIVSIPIFYRTGITFAWVSILIGIVGTFLSGRNNQLVRIDFAHLSERAMLYVVFTFGEMIIAIAGYFENGFGMNTMFFSGMAFLIVAGLFLCYGTLYDHVIDRERETNGTGYMMIHVFLIFALNNITTALEFMREEKIALLPKTLFLIGSFLLYYVFLFLTSIYAKQKIKFDKKFLVRMLLIAVSFVGLMLLFRENMYVNIALTVGYVWGIFFMLHLFGRGACEEEKQQV